MRIENREIVLVVNKVYQPLGFRTIKDILVQLNSTEDSIDPPAKAIQIERPLLPDGTPDLTAVEFWRELTWDEWIELPIRPWDLAIHTPKRAIRVPTVIVTTKYAKMPKRKPRVSKHSIKERDGNKCQYTGVTLTNRTFSLDHVVPRSRGGKDVFENLVACHIDVNLKKKDKTPEEAGLKLLRQPRAPLPIPVNVLIKQGRSADHDLFIQKYGS